MAFHRLQIVDGIQTQPIERGERWLICNGEVWNHSSDVLSFFDAFPDLEDANAIAEGLRRTDGDFALVMTDAMGNVLLARDPVGVKPLYVACDENGVLVAAASEIKALVLLPGINTIHHSPPASFAVFDPCGVKVHDAIYLVWASFRSPGKLFNIADTLRRSVDKRIRHGNKPVALLCSGGLDSSVIACIAKGLLPPNTHAFSVRYTSDAPGRSLDAKYAASLLGDLGMPHTVVDFDWDDVLECVADVVFACETTDLRSIVAAIPLYLLARHIATHTEYKVILSGEGADEIFLGYRYFCYTPSDDDAAEESLRLLLQLHAFDLLRAERSFSAHGLEVRVPFLDTELVGSVLNIKGGLRRPQGQREKGLLRDAFRGEPALRATGILERSKTCLSEGIGSQYWEDVEANRWVFECLLTESYKMHFGRHTEHIIPRTMPEWVMRLQQNTVAVAS